MASPNAIAELRRQFAELPDLKELERKVNRHVSTRVIEEAVENGRIAAESREDLLALAEREPDLVKSYVQGLQPNARQAELNAVTPWSDEDEKAYRREFALAYGWQEDEIP